MQYYMLPEWRFLATGVGLLAILLILPGGLGAGLAEARDGLPPLARQAPSQHPRAEPGRRPARRRAPGRRRRWPQAVAEAVERPEVEEVVEMGT